MAYHTVFGTNPPPYTLSVFTDGGPSIEIGNIFYLTAANGPAIG